LCLLLAVSTAILGYVLATRQPDEAFARVEPSASAPAAQASVNRATAQAGEIALESKGYIIPTRQILVSPQVSGKIIKLAKKRAGDSPEEESLREGMHFDKNEILAELEDTDYQADYDRAVGNLASAQAAFAEAKTGYREEEKGQAASELEEAVKQLNQLNRDVARLEPLLKSKACSEDDYEQTVAKRDAMQQRVFRLNWVKRMLEAGYRKERIEAAGAAVKQAQADLDKAKWRLDNCKIRAPISGTILKKNAEEGNIVNPIAFNGSFSLCEMADLAELEVDLAIQERDISRVFRGQKCRIRAEAFPDRVYSGHVSRLMPIADRAKGAVPVRVKIIVPKEEEGVYLKPEMGALVSFLNGKTIQ
jgi:multidrug resistance efflux pump